LALANTVISDFNEQGRLYSTADSVAAIALMSELNAAGILEGGGVIEINGSSMVYAEAVNCTEPIRSVKVVDGIATVLIDRIVENDWNSYASNVPLRVSLEKNGKHTRKLTAGDAVELVVQLEEGYKMGDLLWIALPDALSRIFGGGQVKLFSLDFQGLSELRVSLAVTGTTAGADGDGEQSLALCVRNMFDEERAGSPGLIAISAKG
ncbi:MAG: general secretion pathway protein GspE, partial [Cyanobacteria bacterium]|nr:general secretion pathway protein GspE [Cyanobacteriota bacterium]